MNITNHLAEVILATESDAILVAGRDGIICFWNLGAVRIFGFLAEEAIGLSRSDHSRGTTHATLGRVRR